MQALAKEQPQDTSVTSIDIGYELLLMHLEQLENGNEQARLEIAEAKRRASQ